MVVRAGQVLEHSLSPFCALGKRCQCPDNTATVALRCQGYGPIEFWPMTEPLDEDQVYRVLAEMGRRGGLARAKKMTPEQRKASATKASKAAAKARTKKAMARKRKV
jgi:hypothetical protein